MEMKFLDGDYKFKIDCFAYEKLKAYASNAKDKIKVCGICVRDKNTFTIKDFALPVQVSTSATNTLTKENIDNLEPVFLSRCANVPNIKALMRVIGTTDNYGKVSTTEYTRKEMVELLKDYDWFIVIAFNKSGEIAMYLKDIENGIEIIEPDWEIDSSFAIDIEEIKEEIQSSIVTTSYSGTSSSVSSTNSTVEEEKRVPTELTVKNPDINSIIT